MHRKNPQYIYCIQWLNHMSRINFLKKWSDFTVWELYWDLQMHGYCVSLSHLSPQAMGKTCVSEDQGRTTSKLLLHPGLEALRWESHQLNEMGLQSLRLFYMMSLCRAACLVGFCLEQCGWNSILWHKQPLSLASILRCQMMAVCHCSASLVQVLNPSLPLGVFFTCEVGKLNSSFPALGRETRESM